MRAAHHIQIKLRNKPGAGGRIEVRGQPGQMVRETPISKITRAKWTGEVAQAVQHLLCKCKALPPKKKIKSSETDLTCVVNR
jgi:hypothetical protein